MANMVAEWLILGGTICFSNIKRLVLVKDRIKILLF